MKHADLRQTIYLFFGIFLVATLGSWWLGRRLR